MEVLLENKVSLVIGGVLLLSVVGFLLYWFVFRKKETNSTPSSNGSKHDTFSNQEEEEKSSANEKQVIGFTSGSEASTVSSYETSSNESGTEGMNNELDIVSSANSD